MAGSYPLQTNPGSFIPTTFIYDVGLIYQLDINSPEFKELIVRLTQSVNNMALVINTKDSGYYVQEDFVNGQIYFPNTALNSSTAQQPVSRQVFRKVINFGVLPNTGTKSVAHGLTITSGFTFTRIYATASVPSANPALRSYIPIPYASTVAANVIELYVDNTNVNITTAANMTAYTVTYVVLEYIKS